MELDELLQELKRQCAGMVDYAREDSEMNLSLDTKYSDLIVRRDASILSIRNLKAGTDEDPEEDVVALFVTGDKDIPRIRVCLRVYLYEDAEHITFGGTVLTTYGGEVQVATPEVIDKYGEILLDSTHDTLVRLKERRSQVVN